MNSKRRLFFLPIFLIFQIYSFCLSAPEDPNKLIPETDKKPSEILGEWKCIAYVEYMTDFSPEKEMESDALFLKGIVFKDKKIANWVFDDNYSHTVQWNPETIASMLGRPALYFFEQLSGENYLFVEWISNDVTILKRKPCYYVLKKSKITNDTAALNLDAIGKWSVVDFVEQIEQFDPKQRSLNSLPPLRKLYFQTDGTVWWIYKDKFKQKKVWSGDAVDYEPSYPAHFTIRKINDKDYMFMEWISGDVTIRGENPRYYVLKKVGQ